MLAVEMPVNDQTPAPSRRFLPPSSSSASKPWSSSSGRRPPFTFSQSNFTPSSASPFTRSSRFEIPAQSEKEDIDTSFGDGNSSPSRVAPLASTLFALPGRDAISDEDENIGPSLEAAQPTRSLRQAGSDVDDEMDVVQIGGSVSVASGVRDRLSPTTPLPKRRKISTLDQGTRDVIHISSSPEPDALVPDDSDDEDRAGAGLAQVETDNHRCSLSPELVTPPMPTRFKTPATKANTIKPLPSKASFKPFKRESHLGAEANFALPDAFSPSRKKGKRDYASGGLADTVRNWVLNAATEESQRSKRDENVITVKAASMDRSGRALEVTDEDGYRWLLLGEQGGDNAGVSPDTLAKVCKRGKVHVRGTSTNWRISLSKQSSGNEVFVAAQWDVG